MQKQLTNQIEDISQLQESKLSIDKNDEESKILIIFLQIVSNDPKNYQWHFNNPQIVGDYNFIDDHKKFNMIIYKNNKEKDQDNSDTEIIEQNNLFAFSPDDRIDLVKNDLNENILINGDTNIEMKNSKINGFNKIEEKIFQPNNCIDDSQFNNNLKLSEMKNMNLIEV